MKTIREHLKSLENQLHPDNTYGKSLISMVTLELEVKLVDIKLLSMKASSHSEHCAYEEAIAIFEGDKENEN